MKHQAALDELGAEIRNLARPLVPVRPRDDSGFHIAPEPPLNTGFGDAPALPSFNEDNRVQLVEAFGRLPTRWLWDARRAAEKHDCADAFTEIEDVLDRLSTGG